MARRVRQRGAEDEDVRSMRSFELKLKNQNPTLSQSATRVGQPIPR